MSNAKAVTTTLTCTSVSDVERGNGTVASFIDTRAWQARYLRASDSFVIPEVSPCGSDETSSEVEVRFERATCASDYHNTALSIAALHPLHIITHSNAWDSLPHVDTNCL